ncbi:hypothetical protein [Teredinibacter franksiae]|uniref:hypothetical protein n=1 Tax=Teredinibacter franksiae TaxID=2761453 RepID=UPI001623F897|nr:hypothetical protein [Teredinibacter franksiae]
MTLEEIENYIARGSRGAVCVFRQPLEQTALLIMSIYITGKVGAYCFSVEFDPIDEVDNGEGWCWQSGRMSLKN